MATLRAFCSISLFVALHHFNQILRVFGGKYSIELNARGKDYTNEPDYVKPLYHHPNAYEAESYKFWKRAEAFPHFHGPEPMAGRLHQHYPKYNDAENYQNFITDPPGVGLNAEDNSGLNSEAAKSVIGPRGNNKKNGRGNDGADGDFAFIQSYNDTDKAKAAAELPHHKKAKGTKSRIVDFDIENQKINLNDNSSRSTLLDNDVDGSGSSLISNDDSSSNAKVAASQSGYGTRCCSCCKSSSYVNPYQNPYGSGAYPYSASGYPYRGAGGGSCCQPVASSCCIPQLPCCPRIQIPCCPVQPICCQPAAPCGVCRSKTYRALRTKRFGCLPCFGRKRRDVSFFEHEDEHENYSFMDSHAIHIRRKRLGCVPCLKKRAKRDEASTFSLVKRSITAAQQCDKSCCDYSLCPLEAMKIAPILRQKMSETIRSVAGAAASAAAASEPLAVVDSAYDDPQMEPVKKFANKKVTDMIDVGGKLQNAPTNKLQHTQTAPKSSGSTATNVMRKSVVAYNGSTPAATSTTSTTTVNVKARNLAAVDDAQISAAKTNQTKTSTTSTTTVNVNNDIANTTKTVVKPVVVKKKSLALSSPNNLNLGKAEKLLVALIQNDKLTMSDTDLDLLTNKH